MSRGLPITEHLAELAHRFVISIIVFGAFFIFFFFFEPVRFRFGTLDFFYPYPNLFNSFSAQAFEIIKKHILPIKMVLINVGSFDTLITSVYMAAILALIFSMPVLVYEAFTFISPGLKMKEKKMLSYALIPSSLLFAVGVVFSYEILLPVLFRFLYYFTVGFGVQPTVSVKAFISIVIAYMIALGLSFQLPLIMAVLSYINVVSYQTWIRNWRYGIVLSFFIALLISPGATGGIMEITIALILSLLYISGGLLARYITKKRKVP